MNNTNFKILIRYVFIIIACISLIIFSRPTYAYNIMGHTVDITQVFYAHSDFSDLTLDHFEYAQNEWEKYLNGWDALRVSSTRHNRTTYPTKDSINSIYRINVGSGQYLMQTRCYTSNDILTEADVNVNVYYSWNIRGSTGKYDIWTVFLHEMGHVLGMNHEDDETSVMASNISSGTEIRSLYAFDIKLLKILYNL